MIYSLVYFNELSRLLSLEYFKESVNSLIFSEEIMIAYAKRSQTLMNDTKLAVRRFKNYSVLLLNRCE